MVTAYTRKKDGGITVQTHLVTPSRFTDLHPFCFPRVWDEGEEVFPMSGVFIKGVNRYS